MSSLSLLPGGILKSVSLKSEEVRMILPLASTICIALAKNGVNSNFRVS